MTLTEFLLERIAEDEARVPEMDLLYPYDGGWSPEDCARMAAECDVKRRIVKRLNGRHLRPDAAHEAQFVLRTLALPYADHPDYRNQWAP